MIEKPTGEECVFFTFSMLHILNERGFNIHNAREAFFCLNSMLDQHMQTEIKESMEELKCQNWKATSGTKNTVPIN